MMDPNDNENTDDQNHRRQQDEEDRINRNMIEKKLKLMSSLDNEDNGISISNLDTVLDSIIEENSCELPKSLIITNMDIRIFNESSDQRIEFEKAFRQLDPDLKFFFFKSFRRARIDFSNNRAATKARIILNQVKFGDEPINCYFAEVAEAPTNEFLKPPALEKQFLISPPASPPEGWEPSEEAQPILNIDLQTALANLIPGSTHELHPPSTGQPGIVVHICDDSATKNSCDETSNNDENDNDLSFVKTKVKIAQTPCPPSMQKLRQN